MNWLFSSTVFFLPNFRFTITHFKNNDGVYFALREEMYYANDIISYFIYGNTIFSSFSLINI